MLEVNQGQSPSGVEFYSGFERDERPVAVVVEGRRLPVSKVIREERIGCPLPEGGYHRTFLVETEDGSLWSLREDPGSDRGWEIQRVET